MKKISLLLLLFVLLTQNVAAQLRLPSIFSDGMVMQRNTTIPVWGWGTPGEKVTVSLDGKSKAVKVGKDGTWKVSMAAMPAGGPYTLKVSAGKTQITPITMFIGDVFLFSGQSNQELPIRRCMDDNYIAHLAKTYTNSNVHILKLPQQFNYTEAQSDCRAINWVTISPQTAGEIAALSYLVGKEIQEYVGVPVGIINSSVGGTRVEAWMSRKNLSQFPEYKEELQKLKYFQTNWVDSIRNIENEAVAQWNKEVSENDIVLNQWQKSGYDFSSWQRVNIFDEFYNPKMPNGYYWFRNTFYIDDTSSKASALLRLGAMRDADEVFVNGVKVGSTSYQYPPRKYEFPASVLRKGENEVMIHLMSEGGTPHFIKEKPYQLEYGNRAILLDKGWTMKIGKLMPRRPSTTYFVDTPVGLYNAMIHPLGNLTIRGMVWYQGEANVGRPYHYKEYLQAMIDEWHLQFPSMPELKGKKKITTPWPSVVVQLAAYMDRHKGAYNSGWCDIRQQQLEACRTDKSVIALATSVDCGEWNDIHPQDKATISHRIALQLQRHVYGDQKVSEGPLPVSCITDGANIIVNFSEDTGKLRHFDDGIAKVTGDYQITIDIKSLNKYNSSTYTIINDGDKQVLRYAHDDFPLCTIYNTNGLASPQWQMEIVSK